MPFGKFANWIRTDHDWHYLQMATGHDATTTAPRELATTLIEIARKSTSQVANNADRSTALSMSPLVSQSTTIQVE